MMIRSRTQPLSSTEGARCRKIRAPGAANHRVRPVAV